MNRLRLLRLLWKKFRHIRSVQHYWGILEPYLISGFAPPHAAQEILTGDERKFWSVLWEAMLYWHLNETKGITLAKDHVSKTGQKGPDFCATLGNRKIWIEAIAPAPSDIPEDWLAGPEVGKFRVRTKPFEAILLRWTSAIKTKRDSFDEYQRRQIVRTDDCTVIAVSSCLLHDYAFEDVGVSQLPTAVEAVLPIGPYAVSISPRGERLDHEAVRVPRFEIRNRNDSPIRTDSFLNPAYANISAVVGSYKKDLTKNDLDLVLIHNPLAKTPLPVRSLGAASEYVVEMDAETFTLKKL